MKHILKVITMSCDSAPVQIFHLHRSSLLLASYSKLDFALLNSQRTGGMGNNSIIKMDKTKC